MGRNIMSLLPYGAYSRGYGYPGYGYPGAYPYGPYGMTSDEIAKIREAEEKAFQEAEEKRKEFMEAEKKKYEDFVAAEEKELSEKLGPYAYGPYGAAGPFGYGYAGAYPG